MKHVARCNSIGQGRQLQGLVTDFVLQIECSFNAILQKTLLDAIEGLEFEAYDQD